MPLAHWLQLSLTSGIGPILIGRMVEKSGSAENAISLSVPELQLIGGIGIAKARTIRESLKKAASEVEQQLRLASESGVQLLCRDDESYPPLLRSIPDPPAVLYVQGKLEPRDLNAIGIVGSRRCSHYGREQADRFAALLAGAGFTVISGGARGIDSAAHRGALRHPLGRTIAIVGSGLDITYPSENKELYKQIAQRGAVISEFPFGTPPAAENFPRRNRVVSGLSRGVLVVEADKRSGALITARQANEEHGRPVFALPGRVDNELSQGPHQLIRDGAILTTSLDDIIQGLGPLPEGVDAPGLFDTLPITPDTFASPDTSNPAEAAAAPSPAPLGNGLLAHLSKDPATVDQIIDRSGMDAGSVLRELTYLTLRGLVKRIDGQTYARV